MIEALRFVKGAVSEKGKDLVPEMAHFRIVAGSVMAFNGRMALCSPIDLDITAAPKADKFVKALSACGDATSLHMTKSGRLAVRSGKFRAYIDCIEDYAYDHYPAGETYAVPDNFLEVLRSVSVFIGADASRPWSMAIHVADGSMMATNNIIAVERWLGGALPSMTIPHFAIKELLRIGQPPTAIQTDGHSASFWYADKRWLRTQLVEAAWPRAQFVGLLDDAPELQPVPEGLAEALEKLEAFSDADSRVYLTANKITTSADEELGAAVDFEGLPDDCVFNIQMLRLVCSTATAYNLQTSPAHFRGDKIRGVLMAMSK